MSAPYVWDNADGDVIGSATGSEIVRLLEDVTGIEWTHSEPVQDESGEYDNPSWHCGTLQLSLGDHYHERPWGLAGATGCYMEGSGWHPLEALAAYAERALKIQDEIAAELRTLIEWQR